jgi:phage regulator Rha-like protein
MNNVLSNIVTKTMSSLEIAKLTGKEHSKVMADIKRVLDEAEIDHAVFGGIFLDSYKREQSCFNLPRRECDLIIAGYSVKYRLAIIDRWHELESKPLTIVDYARALVIAHDENEKLLLENQSLKDEIVEIKDDGKMMETLYEINLANKTEDSNDNQWAVSRALRKLRGR